MSETNFLTKDRPLLRKILKGLMYGFVSLCVIFAVFTSPYDRISLLGKGTKAEAKITHASRQGGHRLSSYHYSVSIVSPSNLAGRGFVDPLPYRIPLFKESDTVKVAFDEERNAGVIDNKIALLLTLLPGTLMVTAVTVLYFVTKRARQKFSERNSTRQF